MAFFSNSTEAEIWKEQNCYRCLHWNEDSGCPVENVHWLYCYEAQGRKHNGDKMPREILDLLIPSDKKGHADTCSMFIEKVNE